MSFDTKNALREGVADALGFVLGGTLLAAGATLITIDLITTRDSRDRADVDLGLGLASFSLTVRR